MSASAHASLLARLLPQAYEPNAPRLAAELAAEGLTLDRINASAASIADAVTPFNAAALLMDWERVCGLTPAPGATYAQRLDSVLAKLQETGGLSIAYFVALAARLGYAITITEFEAFHVDHSRVDVDALYEADAHWVWHVHVQGGTVRTYPFYVDGSCVDEPLLCASDPTIEAVFNDLKPAHTFAVFDYEETTP